ncbi:F-box domain [Cedratvirus A11]|uniref:F-box domain n=1 Tax=Cedratvirus A11 TaxID=1903266 RepID=A0A1M7XTZ0_9VIRU|nr:F-box domain [Cedratvirus A11]SHO33135.1 F-box domain [Cedratvirus A11]
MDSVLFSVMCHSQARDLSTLSSLCKQTRHIFTSKSFWKERFTLLGIQHEEPSLQVYRRCLKIEKRLLSNDWPRLVFYRKLNLNLLAEMDTSTVLEFKETCKEAEELNSELEKAEREGNLATYYYCANELRTLFNHYLVIERKKGKYTIFKQRERYDNIGHEIVKVPLLQDVSKIEALNVLLRLYKN